MIFPLPHLPAAYSPVLRERVASTNDEARALALDGADAGTVVWALEQTAGRGRRGRAWSSPRGNLYASMILRPACSAEHAAQLGFVTALAVCDAVRELVPGIVPLACKWPNDVLFGGRKIAGILLEAESAQDEDDRLAFLIVGVGVNLVSAPGKTEFPATSLVAEGLPAPPPEAALAAFVRHFDGWSRRWQQQGFAPVRETWRERAFALGGQIRVSLDAATLQGRFVDIDQRGALLLETGGGLRRISAGEVFPAH